MAFNIARGPKDQIETAIAAGKISEGAFVVTNDNDDAEGNELVIVERDKTPVVVTSRTQEAIKVMGVTLSSEVADGKTLPAGMNLDDFVKLLVQKRIAASYTAPTIALANNGGQAAATVEAGTSVSIKLKSTFTQKDAGAVTSHVIKRGDTEIATGTEATLTGEETFVVPDGTTTYKSTAEYAAGAVKNDNFGDASPTGKIEAGSKTSSAYNIVGARKAFYGALVSLPETIDSDAIRGLANNKLAPAAGDKLTVQIAEGQQHLIVSLPAGRTLSQVTYVDLGDKGMLAKFTQSTVAVAGASESAGNNTNNVYVYSMASPAAAAMNFELLLA